MGLGARNKLLNDTSQREGSPPLEAPHSLHPSLGKETARTRCSAAAPGHGRVLSCCCPVLESFPQNAFSLKYAFLIVLPGDAGVMCRLLALAF